jgi:flagellar FlgN protein
MTGANVVTNESQQTARALTHTLESMIDEHGILLDAVREHRAALSRADREAVAEAMRVQTETIGRIRDLDKDRRNAFGHATTVQDIASVVHEEARAELLELGAKLRECIETVRAEQAVVEVASRALLGHMEGLFRQVSARLSHAGTYGRGGCIDAGQQIVSGMDLTR